MWASLNKVLNDLDGAVKDTVETLAEDTENSNSSSSGYGINNTKFNSSSSSGGRTSPYDPEREVVNEYEEELISVTHSSNSSSSSSAFNKNTLVKPIATKKSVSNNIITTTNNKIPKSNNTTTLKIPNTNTNSIKRLSPSTVPLTITRENLINGADNKPIIPPKNLVLSSGQTQTELIGSVKLTKDYDKEIKHLNQELLDNEKEVNGLKKEVEAAWKTYKTAQEHAATRESNLQDEISIMKRAKDTDKKEMVAQMQSAGNEFDTVKQRVISLENEKESLKELLEQTQEKVKLSEKKSNLLETDLASAQSGSMQSMQTIQERLRNAELAADRLRTEHAAQTRQSQSRYIDLETANNELVVSLTERDREVVRLQQQLNEIDSSNGTTASREIDGLKHQYDLQNTVLEDLRARNIQLEKEIVEMDHKSRALIMASEDERQRAKEASDQWAKQVAELRERLSDTANEAEKAASIGFTSEVSELQAQVQNLGSQLLKKQNTVQELVAERSGTKAKLQQLQSRCENAEGQLSKFKDVEDNTYDLNNGNHMMKKRSSTKMVSEFEKFGVKATPGVARAIDGFDGMTIMTGKFLKSYPLLRFGFVLYLAFLHLWVFVALSYASSLNLDEEASLDPLNVVNNGVAPN